MAQVQTSKSYEWQASIQFPSVFEVTLSSDPRMGWIHERTPLRKIESSALRLVTPATKSRRYSVNSEKSATDIMARGKAIQEDSSRSQPIVGENWLDVAAETLSLPEVWAQVLSEVQEYTSLEADWRGPGTAAVTEEVGSQATLLVKSFAEALPNGRSPMVGADDDGFIVMTWDDGDLLGNLSVRGGGLYSYYVRRAGKIVKNARAEVAASIPQDLVLALRS